MRETGQLWVEIWKHDFIHVIASCCPEAAWLRLQCSTFAWQGLTLNLIFHKQELFFVFSTWLSAGATL